MADDIRTSTECLAEKYQARLLGSRDLDAIMALQREVIASVGDKMNVTFCACDPEFFNTIMAGTGLVAGLVDGGELVASAALRRLQPDEEDICINAGISDARLPETARWHCMMVAPAHRGQGLQRRLYAFMYAQGRRRGIHDIIGTVHGSNLPSLRNALATGFRVIGVTRNRYADTLLLHNAGGAMPKYRLHREIESTDYFGQRRALAAGLRGFHLRTHARGFYLQYGRQITEG